MIFNYKYDTSFYGDAQKGVERKTPFSVGYTDSKNAINDEKMALGVRQASGMPTAGAASVTGASMGTAGKTAQQIQADRLRAALGGGPTAGVSQLNAANEQAKKGLYASAFTRPGANPAMARATANQGALMDAQTARQGDMMRAQEQQAALGQYAALGSQMSAADVAEANEQNKINMANAGFQTQSALANQDAALRWQAMNDAQRRALLGMSVDLDQNDYANKMGYYDWYQQKEAAWLDQRRKQDALANARTAQAFATAVTFGMGGLGGGKGG